MKRNTLIGSAAACGAAAILYLSCQGEATIRTAQYAANGRKLYTTHCQNCHGAQGEGLSNLYPPLTDTAYLSANRDRLACIIRNGMTGTITVDGRTFNGEMPSNRVLSAVEIAYILTYVGNSFGNEMGLMTEAEVRQALDGCLR